MSPRRRAEQTGGEGSVLLIKKTGTRGRGKLERGGRKAMDGEASFLMGNKKEGTTLGAKGRMGE